MDEQFESVLEDAFPRRDVDDVGAAGPSWNEKNRTVRVEFADGETAYLKVAADGDGSRIARESAVVDYVDARFDVAVPTVLASDADGDPPYLATAAYDGERHVHRWGDCVSDEERAELARGVGEALASLHRVRFDAHGHVTGGDAGGLELDTAPWTDVLVDTVESVRDIAPAERFGHHFDDVVAAVEANRDVLDAAPAALLHGDPAHPNCFWVGDRLGFVDWELAHVGDPVREIRRARRQQFEPLHHDAPETIVGAFYDGYRARAGSLPDGFDVRRPVYDAVTFLGTSTFFEKWAPRADEPTEELAEWVRAEMDRRLAAIE